MEYRSFGRLDWKVSALGFGAMRLPTTDTDPRGPNVNREEAVRMIRYAIDNGVNYVDTAYVYHGGKSEGIVAEALRDGYRDKVRVADKSPIWMINSPADFDRILDEQLQRLATDHIDFYLLHGLNSKTWNGIVLKQNLIEKANAAIRDGRIRHLGFSFHDDGPVFDEILNGYDAWTFCQIQYNYMDEENQAGTRGLKLAAEKGLAVIVMEPLLGGRLANPPARIREIIDRSGMQRTPAQLALDWVWDHAEVSTVLSGMSSMEQVEANIRSAQGARVNSLTAADLAIIDQLKLKYREGTVIPCTKCSYCMPCPNGVNIPRNFELFNDGHLHEDMPESRAVYRLFTPPPERASECIECKECEGLCPQQIPISEWMPKVAAELGS